MRSWRDLVLITSHRVGSVAPDPVDVPAAIRFTARIIRRAGRNGQVESAPQQLARVLVPRQSCSLPAPVRCVGVPPGGGKLRPYEDMTA